LAGAFRAQGRAGQPRATEEVRGLTAINGYFETVRHIIPQTTEGVSAQRLNELLLECYTQPVQPGSLRTMRRILATELDLFVVKDGHYHLSGRGERLVGSGSPDELQDHLLHRILGVDHILKLLNTGPKGRDEINELLSRVRPSWSSDVMPRALLSWLESLQVVSRHDDTFRLTERGQGWAAAVSWEPEIPAPYAELVVPDETMDDDDADADDETIPALATPTFDDVWTRMQESSLAAGMTFSCLEVEQLHADFGCTLFAISRCSQASQAPERHNLRNGTPSHCAEARRVNMRTCWCCLCNQVGTTSPGCSDM
jgi:hypothetical protein